MERQKTHFKLKYKNCIQGIIWKLLYTFMRQTFQSERNPHHVIFIYHCWIYIICNPNFGSSYQTDTVLFYGNQPCHLLKIFSFSAKNLMSFHRKKCWLTTSKRQCGTAANQTMQQQTFFQFLRCELSFSMLQDYIRACTSYAKYISHWISMMKHLQSLVRCRSFLFASITSPVVSTVWQWYGHNRK